MWTCVYLLPTTQRTPCSRQRPVPANMNGKGDTASRAHPANDGEMGSADGAASYVTVCAHTVNIAWMVSESCGTRSERTHTGPTDYTTAARQGSTRVSDTTHMSPTWQL
eukprot:m.127770 g.127770  ORF g.127770 m.127770 type:complete len:109 (-) comp11215_c0_seq4:2039-2365(-)